MVQWAPKVLSLKSGMEAAGRDMYIVQVHRFQ